MISKHINGHGSAMAILFLSGILQGCVPDFLDEAVNGKKEELPVAMLAIAALAASNISSGPQNHLIGSCDTTGAYGYCMEYTGWGFTALLIQDSCNAVSGIFSTGACPNPSTPPTQAGTCIMFPGTNGEFSYVYYSNYDSIWTPGALAAAQSTCQAGEAYGTSKWIP